VSGISTTHEQAVDAAEQVRRRSRRDHVEALERRLPRSYWPLAGVAILYVVAAFIIPTGAEVGISDDWTYVLSVEHLVNDGTFEILPVSAATMVFQLFWGGLFGFLFGMSFAVLRVSTIVITGLGGLAVFGISRELGVRREQAALGAAVYLFNPILFSISYSFMTDPHFLGLLAISSYFYLRGAEHADQADRYLLLGSIVAALACLQRPHGALIPFSVVLFLIGARRLRFDRESLRRFLQVVAIPAATFLLYYLVISQGLPSQQGLFWHEARAAGITEGTLLAKRIAIFEAVYGGFFLLPLALAAIPLLWRLIDLERPRAWVLVLGFHLILVGGAVAFWKDGRRMPYIPHFFGRGGPGSYDVQASKPPLGTDQFWNWFTVICIVAASIASIAIIRGFAQRAQDGTLPAAAMVATIGLVQAAGVIPQSLMFRNWIVSLDRYLLPITPFLIPLFLWSVRRERYPAISAWIVTIAIALFSIAGTRDMLVFQETVWGLGRWLNAQQVPNTMIDAGYPWDAYHLWEYSEMAGITEQQTPGGPWWTEEYGRATDSTYVVAGGPLPGYTTIAIQPYSSWLQGETQYLLVLRREGYAGPP
jgi:4-amino-4-deoxy-L-arabinose transferase-like glycosyltransferase